ncbi:MULTISPECIES: HAD family hydrolase [unclassified Treponema]|uniref:HAD family hydrolase n=1 Tax=unclassified Treponema TaxID=2638727 RepID=UPI0020A44EFB|nr:MULTISPECIES: HAD family hydrolase [unclassified Treponema]UTC66071.1 HAD family hydrolase [Treponema sp. OMZ 789]UTC68801.1 HAD family hydrolase [Treponema sp. OMZ 790]UTC71529.1 HAD family hydrolase [Treponema sp. OMZ 791]
MKYGISAIAFDIDGTLYPSWRFNLRIIPFLLKNFNLMSAFNKTRKDIRLWQEKNPDKLLSNFFDFQAEILAEHSGKTKEDVKNFLETEIYTGWKKRFARIKPYFFVKEAIEEFKRQGLKIGLLSDFLPEQKNDVWGILPLCDASFGTESIGALKPSPLPFQKLAEALEEPCSKILYVGNNLKYDVAGAKSAGMYTACIKGRFFILLKKLFFQKEAEKPDIYFSNYRQLLKFMI